MKNNYLLWSIVGIVCAFTMHAIIFRGKQAFEGITWGIKKDIPVLFDEVDPCKDSGECIIQTHVNLGAYDPNSKLKNSDKFALQHEFISWKTYEKGDIDAFFDDAANNKRWPLLTIEPYPLDDLSKENIFTDIAEGRYDEKIDAFCTDVEDFGKPVFIRWGHEMENVTGRYPWAQENSEGYISAYRYVVERCRASTSLGYYVWSPVGNKNLSQYWPGKEVVDYVGISVFIFPDWEMAQYKRVRSFDEIFNEKYQRVAKYGLPIMIAEFGVTGGKSTQKNMILQAFKDTQSYSQLKTVSFFNAKDTVGVWGDSFATPDWTIDSELLDHIAVK